VSKIVTKWLILLRQIALDPQILDSNRLETHSF